MESWAIVRSMYMVAAYIAFKNSDPNRTWVVSLRECLFRTRPLRAPSNTSARSRLACAFLYLLDKALLCLCRTRNPDLGGHLLS